MNFFASEKIAYSAQILRKDKPILLGDLSGIKVGCTVSLGAGSWTGSGGVVSFSSEAAFIRVSVTLALSLINGVLNV